jgi:elongation factor Ts
MIEISTNREEINSFIKSTAHEIAMHIAASNPESINCLLTQPFIKDDSKTITELLEETAKRSNCEAKIKNFVRFHIS